jgi:hypothetical protein
VTRSLYRSLLWLYPPDFRARFTDEMLWIYDETASVGVIPLFADGFASLLRQWTERSTPLAVAGLGGALHMALFLIMILPMSSRLPYSSPVRHTLLANISAPAEPTRLSGAWVGALRSTGPSGPIELILAKRGAAWTGKLYIQGPDGQMHSGPLQDVEIEGDSLRFRIQAADADMMFTGRLRQGKLTGVLEATASGSHVAWRARGKKVGEGTWQMARAASPNAAGIRRSP